MVATVNGKELDLEICAGPDGVMVELLQLFGAPCVTFADRLHFPMQRRFSIASPRSWQGAIAPSCIFTQQRMRRSLFPFGEVARRARECGGVIRAQTAPGELLSSSATIRFGRRSGGSAHCSPA